MATVADPYWEERRNAFIGGTGSISTRGMTDEECWKAGKQEKRRRKTFGFQAPRKKEKR